MGVKDLWSILSPVCEKKSLWELENKVVAIDLSAWICDSQSVYVPSQVNMYLRNLFFRTSYLLLLGVKPIFVLEGKAPELKTATIKSRLNKVDDGSQNPNKKVTRNRLTGLQKQCVDLLSSLGLTCVQGTGEAEAYCAHLNKLGIADGIITQDSDAFLYGAREVYRNFQMSPNYTCDAYSMDVIEAKLGLTRTKLVGFSLLVGSDYCNKVHKLGKADALKFIVSLQDDEVIQRFVNWRNESVFSQFRENKFLSKDASLEMRIREKCMADPQFPDLEVVTEYMSEPAPIEFTFEWTRPNLSHFVGIAIKKLQWDEDYAVQKFVPLLARWHLLNPTEASELKVTSIVGVPTGRYSYCFKVNWNKYELTSVEPKDLVESAYPLLVEAYLESKTKKKKRVGNGKNRLKPSAIKESCPTGAEEPPAAGGSSELDLSAIIRDIISRPDSNPARERLKLSSFKPVS